MQAAEEPAVLHPSAGKRARGVAGGGGRADLHVCQPFGGTQKRAPSSWKAWSTGDVKGAVRKGAWACSGSLTLDSRDSRGLTPTVSLLASVPVLGASC